MASKRIKIRFEASLTKVAVKEGPISLSQWAALIEKGVKRFEDFFDCVVERAGSGEKAIVFRGGAISPANAVQCNGSTITFNTNKSVVVTLAGIERAGMHETAHSFFGNHKHWAAYSELAGQFSERLNEWSHVLWWNPETRNGGSGYHFQGTFSPREVSAAIKSGKFGLAAQPIHPFVAKWMGMSKTLQARNLPKLKAIVTAYGANHARMFDWQSQGV